MSLSPMPLFANAGSPVAPWPSRQLPLKLNPEWQVPQAARGE
jgi:hypothetical protein